MLKLPKYETNVLEFLCQQANNLTNCAVYALRQALFMTGVVDENAYPLQAHLKEKPHYKIVYSQVAQQLVMAIAESFRAFKGTQDIDFKGKIGPRPKLPGYRQKAGLAGLTYPRQNLKLDIATG